MNTHEWSDKIIIMMHEEIRKCTLKSHIIDNNTLGTDNFINNIRMEGNDTAGVVYMYCIYLVCLLREFQINLCLSYPDCNRRSLILIVTFLSPLMNI